MNFCVQLFSLIVSFFFFHNLSICFFSEFLLCPSFFFSFSLSSQFQQKKNKEKRNETRPDSTRLKTRVGEGRERQKSPVSFPHLISSSFCFHFSDKNFAISSALCRHVWKLPTLPFLLMSLRFCSNFCRKSRIFCFYSSRCRIQACHCGVVCYFFHRYHDLFSLNEKVSLIWFEINFDFLGVFAPSIFARNLYSTPF